MGDDRGDVEEPKRGPGRPRKWADDAERMRAYRAKVAHERDVIKAGGTYVDMAEQIAELTRQRDKNWAQVERLQEQIKTLNATSQRADRRRHRSGSTTRQPDNPDDADDAAFETATSTHRGAADHAECDAEIGRLETELAATERHNADLKAIVRKLEGTNSDLASRLITATNMPESTPAPAARPAMSRAQRREAERQAKRKQRRS